MALNAISALTAALALGIVFFPWQRLGRDAFAVVPVLETVLSRSS